MHVSAVQKHPETYEHVDPEAVGNRRRVLVSELSRQVEHPLEGARVRHRPRPRHAGLPPDPRPLKALEDEGFQFEGAEASFELLMERALGRHRPYFELEAYRVIVEEQSADRGAGGRGHRARAREGHPRAHRGRRQRPGQRARPRAPQGAGGVLPQPQGRSSLLDYKVRILDESKGTAAKTRVLITSGDGEETWGTVGVADNIIEASWQALVDSIEYKLRADQRRDTR